MFVKKLRLAKNFDHLHNIGVIINFLEALFVHLNELLIFENFHKKSAASI
jgi:hypothetical protein